MNHITVDQTPGPLLRRLHRSYGDAHSSAGSSSNPALVEIRLNLDRRRAAAYLLEEGQLSEKQKGLPLGQPLRYHCITDRTGLLGHMRYALRRDRVRTLPM